MRIKSKLFLAASACLTLVVSLAIAATQWSMQPQQSKLTFVAVQAGASFEGAFEKFDSRIAFDPQDLAASRFEVTIDLKSVNTRDDERDSTLKGPDLLAVDRWPQARYVTERFSAKGDGKFVANGKLTLRNVTRDVPIEFTFEKNAQGAWLRGSGKLKRLDFGVGQAEWRDTSTVGDDVQVRFTLRLT